MNRLTLAIALLFGWPLLSAAQEPPIAFAASDGKLVITAGKAPIATYVYRDKKITRPYFAHVFAPGKIQVTRNHPPVAGKDAADHADMHPGIWLAFGDIGGADNWRNKARVEHVAFVEKPMNGAFAVRNRYLANDGKRSICEEVCRYTFLARPGGVLLLLDSEFRSSDKDFAFGDQEEMGLGVRLATPLTVKSGGRIVTSDGQVNEKQVRGKSSAWCDYGGTIDGRRVGVTLMQHPENFRPAWYHARDYGLLVANPFGKKALTGGAVSRVIVKQSEPLRLRFGVFLHGTAKDETLDLAAAYRDYVKACENAD